MGVGVGRGELGVEKVGEGGEERGPEVVNARADSPKAIPTISSTSSSSQVSSPEEEPIASISSFSFFSSLSPSFSPPKLGERGCCSVEEKEEEGSLGSAIGVVKWARGESFGGGGIESFSGGGQKF